MLLLLVACVDPKDSADSPTVDDSRETAVDSSHETAESSPETAVDTAPPHTGESDTTDTTDTTDTGPTEPEWAPGDDIPGWEDADCPAPIPGLTARIDWPSLFLLEAHFLDGVPAAGPQVLTLQMRDCLNFACDAATLSREDPFLEGLFDGTAATGGEPQGTYGPTEARAVHGDGRGIVGDWTDDGSGPYATVTACLSRVRPDEIRGVLWTEFAVPASFSTVDFGNASMYFAYPFDIRFPDHSGFDTTLPDTADPPDGYAQAHYLYDVPYADAWPWDEITDPTVAAALYERYRPYNDP